MNPRSSLCQLFLMAVLVSPAVADSTSIVVRSDSYVLYGKTYGDLASLASALPAQAGDVIDLEACMPGSSDTLTAAVHRFADRTLHIAVLDASAPACAAAPAMVPVAHLTMDTGAAERFWSDLAP